MSESCNLYLNPKWKASEIKTLVERLTGKPTKWNHIDTEGDYVRLVNEELDISVFFNIQTPIGTFTMLSRGAMGVELFRKIASVIGGLLLVSDYTGKLEMIGGNVSENNALPFFLRHAIVKDGIEPDDIEGLQDSMSRWYDRCDRGNKPDYLKYRPQP